MSKHYWGILALAAVTASAAHPQQLPTGQSITPLAAPGATFAPLVAGIGPNPSYQADGAAAVAVSPDKRTMLVLTSGFNRYVGADGKVVPTQSGQYIFVYAIGDKGAKLQQTMQVPNAFSGIAWAPDGKTFYVGGGLDDAVYSFELSENCRATHLTGHCPFNTTNTVPPIKLNHSEGVGVDVKPQAAGVAVSPDGAHLLVANYYNDSVTLIDTKTRTVIAEQDLRPGKIDPAQAGVAGGEYPVSVIWRDNRHAYVSAARDREIVVLELDAARLKVTKRIKTMGEPTALLYDAPANRIYASEDNADRLAIVDTDTDSLTAEPRMGLPDGMVGTDVVGTGKGTNPNGLFMTPKHHLLVTLGGINALAFIDPHDANTKILGLIPTGWYPSGVATSADGGRVFVVNRKSPPGANPKGCAPRLASTKIARQDACGPDNQYIYQLEKAGLLQFPMLTPRQLKASTLQVAINIGVPQHQARAAGDAVMAQLRAKIKHVIYIVKENRTYDQVLGDLEVGNGDPSLAILGKALSPNHHAMARQFVTLDNFLDSGEQSSTGWTWTTTARATDLLEKTAPINYSRRGLAYDSEEADRNIPTAMSLAERRANNPKTPNDPDILPGKALATAPDADRDDLPNQGFIWSHAIRAGLSVRNYGVADASVYDEGRPGAQPLLRDPFKDKHPIYTSGDPFLATRSDPYFRGFDQQMPDYWRELEWEREFDQQIATKTMPALTMMRLSHDHFGDFDRAIDKVNTVETEMADNDYALGRLIERVSKSTFANETLIFVIEDDAQNGADHMDARRSIAFVVGAYVKQNALVSTRYTTVNMLRTIEGVLGLKPMGLNDALAVPMADVFDLQQKNWAFTARASDVLKTTDLPIPGTAYNAMARASLPCPLQTAHYWSAAMKGQDFSSEDKLDTLAFNRALWSGLRGGAQPTVSGNDLRTGRAALLARTNMVCDR